jgi:hypothetical protein
MKSILRTLGAARALATVFACAGKPIVQFAYDHSASFGGVKTYACSTPNFQMPGAIRSWTGSSWIRRVRAAVEQECRRKAYAKDEGDADLYVSYSTNPRGVVSQDNSAIPVVVADLRRRHEVPEGRIPVLDIRDRQHRLVWRGFKQAIIGTNPEAVERDIDDAVDDLLRSSPQGERVLIRPSRLRPRARPSLGTLLSLACAGTHPAPRVAQDPNADLSPPRRTRGHARPGCGCRHGDSIVDGAFLDKRIRRGRGAPARRARYRPAPGRRLDLPSRT